MILLLSLNKTFRVDLNIRYDGKGFYYDLSVLPHAHFFFLIWFLFLKQMILFVLSLSSPIKVNKAELP